MAHEEKRAWIMAIVTVIGYGAYLIVVLGRADGGSLSEVPYVAPLLWTIGAAIVAAIVLSIAADIAAGVSPARRISAIARSNGSASTSASRSS